MIKFVHTVKVEMQYSNGARCHLSLRHNYASACVTQSLGDMPSELPDFILPYQPRTSLPFGQHQFIMLGNGCKSYPELLCNS